LAQPIERVEAIARWIGLLPCLGLASMALAGLRQARQRPKGRTVGRSYETIPLPVYVGAGAIYTAISVGAWRPVPLRLTPRLRLLALVCGGLLYGSGVALIAGGRIALADMYNLSSVRGAELYREHRLVTTGPFSIVRHPMYLGALLAAIGATLLYRTWTLLFICAHVPIFFLRARREEQALAQEFGEEWQAYRRRVRSGVPGL
jgi:protein-S-isoprenylcysteine O-methyltransferase Ste14